MLAHPLRVARPLFKFACVVLALTALGCSGTKDYSSSGERNLSIRTKVTGSVLTKVNARLHLYALRGACERSYLGTVKLDDNEIRIALPPRSLYLKFVFVSSARLGGSSASVPYAVLLTPRPGSEYTADVVYEDRSYHVTVVEQTGRARRVIERAADDCPVRSTAMN